MRKGALDDAATSRRASGGTDDECDRQRFVDPPDEQRRMIRVVAGHYADLLRTHVPQPRFITVTRDPLSRTISAYLHALYHPGSDDLWVG
ncbi:MAG: hypothetical protein ABL971_11530 [Vicinamibacterales bacterium]